ncbi:MAG: SEC-C metal-binding domain-containing protein [Acidobacteria bacterium]|nr:SEC-C metal-binding domain-containing protein [Acidobacteriota bacterium]
MIRRFLARLVGKPSPNFEEIGRNDACPCGSGRKFKQCCIDRAEQQQRASRDASLFGSRKS